MKIFKYFLLLLFLGSFSLSIFMLTQNPAFKIEREFIVDAPKQVVYKYIEDIELWDYWIPTTKHANDIFQIDIDQVGTYLIQNEYKHPYDSLSQDILNDKKISNIKWSFSDENQKTKINFSFVGEMDLRTKLMTFFSGSPDKVVGASMEKYTNALIVYFVKQFKEFEITQKQQVLLDKQNLLFTKHTSTLASFASDVATQYEKAIRFCRQNEITYNQNPLAIISSVNKDTITYDFALVISQDIFLNPDDVFQVKALQANQYYQANLKGNYTHLLETFDLLERDFDKLDIKKQLHTPIVVELNEANFTMKLPSNYTSTLRIAVQSIPSEN